SPLGFPTLYGFAVHRELGSRAGRNNTEKKEEKSPRCRERTTRRRETTKGADFAGWLRYGAPVDVAYAIRDGGVVGGGAGFVRDVTQERQFRAAAHPGGCQRTTTTRG